MIGDRYEIGREVGRGGTSPVFRGRDTVLDRPVALKRLGLSAGDDRPDVERAEREAQLAARLHHPNVVAVYDLVDEGDHRWLVMELVDGSHLGQLADVGGVDAERAARLLAQVAAGLAAAHQLGIVHRDVKPSNVLVRSDDIAKLSDFGVARGRDDEALTRTGIVTGSPAYLAPEVAVGRTATAKSDVWSFGATAFHLVTGRAPYEVGKDVVAAIEHIVDSPPPRLPADHPLAALVATTLQHDPEARPTMDEVRQTLALVAGTWPTRVGTPARPTDGRPAAVLPAPVLPAPTGTRPGSSHRAEAASRRRAAYLAAAAVLVVTGGFGAVQLLGEPEAAPVAAIADPSESSGDRATVVTDFVAAYLRAASTDPAAGFSMLSEDFQTASGGLEGYTAYWGQVSDLEVLDARPGEGDDVVDATWSYAIGGDQREQSARLHVGGSGDDMRITRAETS